MNVTAINNSLRRQIEEAAQEKQDESTIRRLGNALITLNQIPQGNNYALLLSRKPMRNNYEAVYQWIREYVLSHGERVAEFSLSRLREAFHEHLCDLQDQAREQYL